jgi:hypothetical protein
MARAVCPISGIGSHRCLHTSGRGRAVGQILDHRETAMGLCRLSRAVCESVGERRRKLAQVVGATDFGPSRNGDGTEPAAARRLRECGRATARRLGQLADLGYPVTPMVAHMIAEHVTIARRLSDVGTKRIVPVSRCSGRTSIFHLNFSCSGCMRGVHHRGELRAVRTSARWSTRSICNHRSCAGCRSQIARVPERHGVTRG